VPSRLAFGVGLWNSYGGQLTYKDATPINGTIAKTRNAVIEVVPGLAYEVNDILQVGGALRIGIGLFDSNAVARPNDAELSATGVGAGFTLGAMVRPNDQLSLGWFYRSPLNVATKGSATVHFDPPVGDKQYDLEFQQQWPQETGVSAAYRMRKLLLAVQGNWHGWSVVDKLAPKFIGDPTLSAQAVIPTDWQNSWSLHLGAQYSVTPKIDVRGGYTYDTPAVTPQYQERQFIDDNKMTAALGASILATRRIRIDTAFEYLIPRGPRTIPDNSAQYVDNPELANAAPGEHEGKLYTFELALQMLY
jgi:long-chain fatty acid transport protein